MRAVGYTHNRSYAAMPASVGEARSAVGDLAVKAGASGETLDAVRLAVSEVVTNAVLHAYGEDPGTIQVTAAALDDELWILISDDGRGLDARTDSPGLGFGLALVSQVSDDFSIVSRASGGTEVRIRFNLVPDGRAAVATDGQLRGSLDAASRPASERFSTTT
jgi:serine/threonine-protein kinase RsbW